MKEHRKLLPSGDSESAGNANGPLSRGYELQLKKRSMVMVACEACRKKKSRCDGGRPGCRSCFEKDKKCVYETEDAQTSRHAANKNKNVALAAENEQLRELFRILEQKSDHEAGRILTRLRDSHDPIAVLDEIKDGNAGVSTPSSSSTIGDLSLEDIDKAALRASPSQVPARPWTAVAGDGIVSHLVCSFLKYDQVFFYPGLDPESFLQDMRSKDPTASKYCSPLLVNTICALRAMSNNGPTRKYNVKAGVDLAKEFMEEARTHADQDHCKTCLANVQGLSLLFSVYGGRGLDRQGQKYRYDAVAMLQRLELKKRLSKLNLDNESNARDHRTTRRALWGLFCTESINSWAFKQPSLIKPPSIPKFNASPGPSPREQSAADSASFPGQGDSIDLRPSTTNGIFSAQCDLCLLLFDVMTYHESGENEDGDDTDMEIRRRFYTKLTRMRAALPGNLRVDVNTTDQTFYLHSLADMVAIRILQPLTFSSKQVFTSVSDPALSFITSPETVRELLIGTARSTTAATNRYAHMVGPKDFSCMILVALFISPWTLAPFLEDRSVHNMFTFNVSMLAWTVQYFPSARNILLGLRAIVQNLQLRMPDTAMQYFDGLDHDSEVATDVALPEYADIKRGDDHDASDEVMHLGTLISRRLTLSPAAGSG